MRTGPQDITEGNALKNTIKAKIIQILRYLNTAML